MPKPAIVIASDHAGIELKIQLRDTLAVQGYDIQDLGTHTTDSVDYPDFAVLVASAVREKRAARGILICGTGIGISIAANRHRGVRAALCRDVADARLARQHNDANVLVLGARTTGPEVAKDLLATFLATDFEGGRHQRRIDKLDALG